jgi:hypothetical protein
MRGECLTAQQQQAERQHSEFSEKFHMTPTLFYLLKVLLWKRSDRFRNKNRGDYSPRL